MKEKSVFGLAMKPGLIISAAAIAYSLMIWSITSDLEMQKYLGWVVYPILAFGFYYFTINYRDNVKGGYISYGDSFVFMLFMSIVYSVVFALYYYVFLTIIDTEMIVNMMEMVEQDYYNQGLTEAQIEQALKIMGFMFKPWLLSIITMFGGIFIGVLI